jgi:AraC-like DNA-binding protein
MYSYLYLALAVFGLISIIEILKTSQKISIIKLYFILILAFTTINSTIDFVNSFGYDLSLYGSIIRLLVTISLVNVFYAVTLFKIPKLVIYIETILFITYLIAILNGFRFITTVNGHFVQEATILNKINLIIVNPLVFGSMVYNLNKLKKIDDSNLYQVRIKKWMNFLNLLFYVVVISIIASIVFIYNKTLNSNIDSRFVLFFYRLLATSFIFFRPKFIDDAGLMINYEGIKPFSDQISINKFNFLFYSNHYFLKQDANLEDFALKLNHTKEAVVDFLKTQNEQNFNDLLNKSRVDYFKELLKSKQHHSFTIEALSEMSGFNNRRTMYNAFNKYVGMTPSEFITINK